MASKKVLSIELGVQSTRICEIVVNGKKRTVVNTCVFDTPEGAIEDGYIRNNDMFNENLHIWVDRFDEFYPQHMEVLRALADKNVDITIGLNYPEDDDTGMYISMAETDEKVKTLNGYTGDISPCHKCSNARSTTPPQRSFASHPNFFETVIFFSSKSTD